ncbi:MAG TPA: hypothetical protein DCP38_10400 [Acidobacteria bacterium]|nr:hypothetical protein [Acidobacteriota bacterium]HAK55874.1 hypothetical protein [Acidobacteriota bacterium]|tara:strand:- start:2598 stop:3425 length:828 start_codon:yes stop_codon:yes gene_type:complete
MTAAAVACGLLLPLGAMAQNRVFEQTVQLDSGGRLSVEANKGSLQLTAWDREEVEIRARIEAPQNVSADYARRAVEATRIDVSGSGSSVRIEPDYSDVPYREDRWNDNSRSIPFIHFEISAPRQIRLVAESDRGPATISGFEGDLDIETDRGEAMLRDLSGRVQIVIDRGDSSRVEGLSGLIDLEADRADITMRNVTIDDDSRIEIDRGDLEIDLSENQALTLIADLSRRAEFESDFPVTMQSMDGRDFRGTINGGGPELLIESDRGRVRLRSIP